MVKEPLFKSYSYTGRLQPAQSKHSWLVRAYLVTEKLDLPWSGREEAKEL